MSKKAMEVAARYRRKYWREVDMDIFEQYHVTAFPHKDVGGHEVYADYPIITADPEIQDFKWGLIPSWVKTEEQAEQIRNMTMNARMETIFEKPSYRHPIMAKRCIIPSTGYFEYQHHRGGATTPYFIFVKTEEIFSMGGIYDVWHDQETGEIIHTFSMITTPANPLTKEIHNGGRNKGRMPLIIAPQDEERWLDPALTKPDIEQLLKTFGEKDMDAYPVNPDFIHKNHHDPSIIVRM